MFGDCSSLKNLDVSKFGTSKVTNMRGMFAYCSSLKNLDVSKFDTSEVMDMEFMFRNCSSLPATFPWVIDCSSITRTSRISNMFSGSSVTSVTLKNVDDSIKSSITSGLLKGDDTLTINFVDD